MSTRVLILVYPTQHKPKHASLERSLPNTAYAQTPGKERYGNIDVMGCHKELAEQIVDKGGDFVPCVRANQASLPRKHSRKWFAQP